MTVSHPSRVALERFFLGSVASDGDAVAQHLLHECSVCSEVIASWSSPGLREHDVREQALSAAEEAPYEEVVDRMLGQVKRLEGAVEAERREAARMLPRLLRQPFERQLILVRNSRTYRSGAVCELLLEASFERRHDDLRGSEGLARVAVAVATRLDRDRYGDALVNDFQGRAWAHLANARRILGDHAGAVEALRAARALLAEGTGNLLDEALCWDVQTSLHSAREEHPEAIRCAGRAIVLYRRLGDRHLMGRALIQQGMVWGNLGELVREIVVLRTGLELIESDRDPRVALAGWHNLCWALHQAGHHRQALATLVRNRPAYLALGDRTNLLRFQWLEGMIAAALHRDEQAEGCLRQVREGFLQLGVAHHAAGVSLDLAALLCRQGRTADVQALAVEMIAVFETQGSRQEAIAAFILLRQAAERDRVTEALLKRIGSTLQRARAPG